MKTINSFGIKKMLSILCVSLICLSSLLFAGCSADEVGISLKTAFRTSYVENEEIEFSYKDTTTFKGKNIPDLTGGVIIYNYKDEGGKLQSVEIELVSAYYNYSEKSTATYKVKVEQFSTDAGTGSKTMILSLLQNDVEVGRLNIQYKIYKSQDEIAGAKTVTQILTTMNYVARSILSPIIAVMCSVGTIYAIFLGIKMARANNSEQRDEAKKHVVGCVVAIVIGIALMLIFNLFASSSLAWFGGDENAVEFFPTLFIK